MKSKSLVEESRVQPFLLKLKERLFPNAHEKEGFYHLCAISNILHLRWAASFILLLSLIHLFVFISKLDSSSTLEYQWRMLVIGGHIVLFAYFLSYLLQAYFYPNITKRWSNQLGGMLTFLVLLLSGAYFAGVDQLVAHSITPVFIVAIAAPLLILIRPQYALFSYGIFFLLAILLLIEFQDDKTVLLTNIVNVVTVSFVGFFFSLVFWANRLSLFRYNNQLYAQQSSLENANKNLLQITSELEQSNAQKDRVLSVIGHDLRSPFNTLIGTAELLSDEDYDLSADEEMKLRRNLLITSRNTYMLVDNLLEWARLQQKSAQPDIQDVSLLPLIHDLFSELAIVAQSKQIHLTINSDAGLVVQSDPVMLASVLRNLITNAIKFSNKGGEIKVAVSVDAAENAIISVIDQGVGIEAAELENWKNGGLLESKVGTANEPSTGLGLSIVKDMLHLNNGKLLIESAPGKGSRFSAFIPLAK
jgi:signal transduction histidine kinase